MSRPLEAVKSRIPSLLLSALISWALARPLLLLCGLMPEEPLAAAYALGAALVIGGITLLPPKRMWLAPLSFTLLLVLPAMLLPGSLPARAGAFFRSFLSGAMPLDALRLYADALLPLIMLLLCLYAHLAMEGDPAFALPLLCVPPVLAWFLGAKENMALYFPVAACLPLLLAYIHHRERGRAKAAASAWSLPVAVALALALALLATLLTPRLRVTLPQAERAADDLRQAIEDNLFFTGERTAFTLASQGYQPMGEEGLGGRPSISGAPVMIVRGQGALYLRGTVLDTYTGRAWRNTLSGERLLWQSPLTRARREALFDENMGAPGAVQTEGSAEMLADMPSTLFVPQRMNSLSVGSGMVPYFTNSTEVFITRDLRAGDAWSFRCAQLVADSPGFDAPANMQGTAPDSLPTQYLALPSHLTSQDHVATLTRQVTMGISDPYRQALAILRHLKANYTYSLDVPDAPENYDFATHFLLETGRGYCTYFATAMTVMARMAGLPARYVEGFLALPGDGDAVTLTGQNAHAWTEIWLGGVGWVTFDATPAQGDGSQNPGGTPPPDGQQPSPSPSPSPSPEPEGGDTPTPTPEPQGAATPTPPPAPGQEPTSPTPPPGSRFPWWLLLVAALMGLMIWRILWVNPARRARRAKSPAQAFLLWRGALMEALAEKGAGQMDGETALAHAARNANEPRLLPLAQAHGALVYGRQSPDGQAIDLARQTYEDTRRTLNLVEKTRVALRRAFKPPIAFTRGLPGRIMGIVRKGRNRHSK